MINSELGSGYLETNNQNDKTSRVHTFFSKATDPNFKDGRPPKFDEDQLNNAMELLETRSYAQVVKLTGISKSTLVREKKKRRY